MAKSGRVLAVVALVTVVAALAVLGTTASAVHPAEVTTTSAPSHRSGGGPEAPLTSDAASCQDVIFLGARGSGEDSNADQGMGPTVDFARKAYLGAVQDRRVGWRAVTYPAQHVDTLAFPSTRRMFFEGLDQGVQDASRFLKARMRRCSQERYVLAGYSQGAMVMHRVLNRLELVGLPPGRLDGVLLIADGDRYAGQGGRHFASAGRAGDGISWQFPKLAGSRFKPSRKPVPWPLQQRVLSVCLNDDAVCDFGSIASLTAGISNHLKYRPSRAGAPAVRSAAAAAGRNTMSKGAHWPRITSSRRLPDGDVGKQYQAQLVAENGEPGRWGMNGGALPPGLALSRSGSITGIPTNPGRALFAVRFVAADGLAASRDFAIHVQSRPEPAPTQWRSVVAHSDQACGVAADDSGWCWGANDSGTVGVGHTDPVFWPSRLPGVWRSLDTRTDVTCGVQLDSTGWCWGWNRDGTAQPNGPEQVTVPTQIPGVWSTIDVGHVSACGTRIDGTAACWGGGVNAVRELPGVWQSLASPNFSEVCGIRPNGSAWCLDFSGDIETTQVPGEWRDISNTGTPLTCGVRTDSTGWCWGWAGHGATLDDGWVHIAPTNPRQIPGYWKTLNSDSTTCGVRVDGSGWCWGANFTGSVGDGTTDNRSTQYQLPGAWLSITAGQWGTCGIQTDRSGWCWGSNVYGSLGLGQENEVLAPKEIGGNWTTIDQDSLSSCGLQVDGSAWCWGWNGQGSVGVGPEIDEARVPVRVGQTL